MRTSHPHGVSDAMLLCRFLPMAKVQVVAQDCIVRQPNHNSLFCNLRKRRCNLPSTRLPSGPLSQEIQRVVWLGIVVPRCQRLCVNYLATLVESQSRLGSSEGLFAWTYLAGAFPMLTVTIINNFDHLERPFRTLECRSPIALSVRHGLDSQIFEKSWMYLCMRSVGRQWCTHLQGARQTLPLKAPT